MWMKTDAAGQTAATIHRNASVAWVNDQSGDSQRLPAVVLRRKDWSNGKVGSGKYSMSAFAWYVATNKRFEDVLNHMMVLGSRYEALLNDSFKRHHLPDDFNLCLQRHTAALAELHRAAIARALDKTVLPGVREHLTGSFVTTPQDFQDTLLFHKMVQPSDWGRCCRKVPGSDHTTAAKTSRTSSGRVPARTRLRVSQVC